MPPNITTTTLGRPTFIAGDKNKTVSSTDGVFPTQRPAYFTRVVLWRYPICDTPRVRRELFESRIVIFLPSCTLFLFYFFPMCRRPVVVCKIFVFSSEFFYTLRAFPIGKICEKRGTEYSHRRSACCTCSTQGQAMLFNAFIAFPSSRGDGAEAETKKTTFSSIVIGLVTASAVDEKKKWGKVGTPI